VTKKFHSYTGIAYNPGVSPPLGASSSVDDARDAFLVELASFHLSLKKSLMVCEAEARQVEEYQKERERIAMEQINLKDEIETLKTSLEQAQLERKRKMEYDVIAEKINALPTREELEQSIRSLESDMAAIRMEHEDQYRTIQVQRTKLSTAVADLQELRLIGKPEYEQDTTDATANGAEAEGEEVSRTVTPAAVVETSGDVEMSDANARAESGELREEKEDGEQGAESDEDDIPLAKAVSLNPSARPFLPRSSTSRPSTPLIASSSGPNSKKEEGEEEEDIEMGELAEEPKKKVKPEPEELEEGEASDLSSELSEPPDD